MLNAVAGRRGGCPAAAHPPPPSNFSAANKEWSLEEAESLQGAGLEALGGGAFGVGVCHSPPVRPRSLYLTPPPRGPLSSLWFPHQSLSMVLPSLWFPSSLWLVLPPLYGPCAVPAPDPRAAPHSLGAGQSALRAHPIGRAGTNRRPRRVRQRAAGEAGRTRSGGGAGGGCGARLWGAMVVGGSSQEKENRSPGPNVTVKLFPYGRVPVRARSRRAEHGDGPSAACTAPSRGQPR